LERIHQVLTDSLQVFILENADIDPEDDDPFDEYISSVCHDISTDARVRTHAISLWKRRDGRRSNVGRLGQNQAKEAGKDS